MYQQFGSRVDQSAKTVTFRLFIPDGERAPFQYEGGGLPRVTGIFVVGSFQDPSARAWNLASPVPLTPADFLDGSLLKGTVYSHTTDALPDGFYEYKYFITFENAKGRYITDPCGRYGGVTNQNSGFVVGGADEAVQPLPTPRLEYRDLVIYELMIDDFTRNLKSTSEAPLQTIASKLDYLVSIGVNAIEFMPWMAWSYPDDPNSDFSWGYNPIQYFSVAHKYTLNPTDETNKLVYLKRLINGCHGRGLHVIMDGVFNHADAFPPDRGFPYYWLYEDPADSPYVGNFAQAEFFRDLDYANQCTLEYVRDACFYWMDEFKIDGIRLDNTLGFYKPDDRGHGLPKLLSELRAHISQTGNTNFALILEHSWDYSAIDVTNKVGATSCWFDNFRSLSMGYLGYRPHGFPQVEASIMRVLDSARDFGENRTPTIYIENHDHRRFLLKAGGLAQWALTQPYVIALFSCSGAALIYNGQEFGMANDMPEQGTARVVARPLDWTLLNDARALSLLALYTKLIGLRNAHPALRGAHFYPSGWSESEVTLNPQGFGIDRANNVVVFHRWADKVGTRTERIYVALNFSGLTRRVSFEVPSPGPWIDLLTGVSVTATGGRITADVGSNWGALYQRLD